MPGKPQTGHGDPAGIGWVGLPIGCGTRPTRQETPLAGRVTRPAALAASSGRRGSPTGSSPAAPVFGGRPDGRGRPVGWDQRFGPASRDGRPAWAERDLRGGPPGRFPQVGNGRLGEPAGRDDPDGAVPDGSHRPPSAGDPRWTGRDGAAGAPPRGGPAPGDGAPGRVPWGPAPGGPAPGDAVPGDGAPGRVPWGPAPGGPAPGDAVPGDGAPGRVPWGPAPGGPAPGDAVPGDGAPGRAPWGPAPGDPAIMNPARWHNQAGYVQFGGARARVRESPYEGEPFTSPVRERQPTGEAGRTDARRGPAGRSGRDAALRRPWYEIGNPGGSHPLARQASDVARTGHQAQSDSRPTAGLPYAAPREPDERYHADGRRHCGSLERVLYRQWDASAPPPAEIVRAIDRLAELPAKLKDKIAAGIDGIFVGPGGVPDLDDMHHLRGVPLPAGRATWDVCAGAYGGRKIVVGAQPSPTPDVMCHEVGHALDDIETPGQWLSDRAEFRMVYDQCVPHLMSDFHRQPNGLGRREFFADAFAAIASRQRPALVEMLAGESRLALNVMLFFNRRFGI